MEGQWIFCINPFPRIQLRWFLFLCWRNFRAFCRHFSTFHYWNCLFLNDEINHWLYKVFEATKSIIKSNIRRLVTNIISSPLTCLKVNKTRIKSDWCVWMLFCQICGFKYDMASSFIKTYSCVTWEEVETLKSLKNQGSNFPYTLHIHFLCVQRDVLFISWMLLILIPLLRLLYVPSFFRSKRVDTKKIFVWFFLTSCLLFMMVGGWNQQKAKIISLLESYSLFCIQYVIL